MVDVIDEMTLARYEKAIPEETWMGLQMYVQKGIKPGSFLEKVLTGKSVFDVCLYADEENIKTLKPLILFIYNHLPGDCWGDRETYEDWISSGGSDGQHVSR